MAKIKRAVTARQPDGAIRHYSQLHQMSVRWCAVYTRPWRRYKLRLAVAR